MWRKLTIYIGRNRLTKNNSIVHVIVILEREYICDVVLRITEEILEIGVHVLLVQVVLDGLLPPQATLVAACLLLRLHVLHP